MAAATSLLCSDAAKSFGLKNLELAGDAVERAAEVGADSAHNDDSGDSDQRGNEAILDGGCSALIIEAPLQNTKHRNLLTCGLKTRHPRFVFGKEYASPLLIKRNRYNYSW